MTPTDGNTDKFTFDDARKYIQLKKYAKTGISSENCYWRSQLLDDLKLVAIFIFYIVVYCLELQYTHPSKAFHTISVFSFV